MKLIVAALAFFASHPQAELLAASILKEVMKFLLELAAGDAKKAVIDLLTGLASLFPQVADKITPITEQLSK